MSAASERIWMMISRAIVRLVNDRAKAQSVQADMLADETLDDVERFQNYGFVSHPHPGAEAIVVCPGGLRSHAVAIVVEDRRFRLTSLEEGEVAMHDDLGNVILLGRQAITITAVQKAEVVSPDVSVTADKVLVDSPNVQLGGTEGAQVARVGDSVDLSTGKILTGSDKVRAA